MGFPHLFLCLPWGTSPPPSWQPQWDLLRTSPDCSWRKWWWTSGSTCTLWSLKGEIMAKHQIWRDLIGLISRQSDLALIYGETLAHSLLQGSCAHTTGIWSIKVVQAWPPPKVQQAQHVQASTLGLHVIQSVEAVWSEICEMCSWHLISQNPEMFELQKSQTEPETLGLVMLQHWQLLPLVRLRLPLQQVPPLGMAEIQGPWLRQGKFRLASGCGNVLSSSCNMEITSGQRLERDQ